MASSRATSALLDPSYAEGGSRGSVRPLPVQPPPGFPTFEQLAGDTKSNLNSPDVSWYNAYINAWSAWGRHRVPHERKAWIETTYRLRQSEGTKLSGHYLGRFKAKDMDWATIVAVLVNRRFCPVPKERPWLERAREKFPKAAVLHEDVDVPWDTGIPAISDYELQPRAGMTDYEGRPHHKRRRVDSPSRTRDEITVLSPTPETESETGGDGSGSAQPIESFDVDAYIARNNGDSRHLDRLQELRMKGQEGWQAREMRQAQKNQDLQSRNDSLEARIKELEALSSEQAKRISTLEAMPAGRTQELEMVEKSLKSALKELEDVYTRHNHLLEKEINLESEKDELRKKLKDVEKERDELREKLNRGRPSNEAAAPFGDSGFF